MFFEKRPRQYAAEIIDLPTREARREALERVPEYWRGFVADHVRIWWERRKYAPGG